MNRSLKYCVIAVSALALAACASQGGMQPSMSQASAQPTAEPLTYSEAVEKRAREQRTHVRWVNPPQSGGTTSADGTDPR